MGKKYLCDMCNGLYSKLARHQRTCNGIERTANIYKERFYPNEKVKCDNCSEYYTKRHIARHIKKCVHNIVETWTCPYCNKTISSNTNITNHKRHCYEVKRHQIEIWRERERKAILMREPKIKVLINKV